MNITMTITADNPEELFSTIKGCNALIADKCPVATPAANPTPAQSAPAAVAQTSGIAAPTPAYTPAPTTAAPIAPVAAPVATPAPVPTVPAPAYTLDQLNRAGADLVTEHPELMQALQAYLTSLGVQTLHQLSPDMYGSVALGLREMGARI